MSGVVSLSTRKGRADVEPTREVARWLAWMSIAIPSSFGE